MSSSSSQPPQLGTKKAVGHYDEQQYSSTHDTLLRAFVRYPFEARPGHHVYPILFREGANKHWEVLRCFDDFRQLHLRLQRECAEDTFERLPTLPFKPPLNPSPRELNKIRKELQSYLTNLLQLGFSDEDFCDDPIDPSSPSLMGSFATIPLEVLLRIFKYLSHNDLGGKVARTCRYWRRMADSDELWKPLTTLAMGKESELLMTRTWKERFQYFWCAPKYFKEPTYASREWLLQRIGEILATEKEFVEGITLAIEVILIPLRRANIVSKVDIENLFCNLETIKEAHTRVLARLNEIEMPIEELDGYIGIADAILELAPYLDDYMKYCCSQHIIVKTYNRLLKHPTFEKFLEDCHENRRLLGMTFFDFIIKPVSRFCTYPLFMRCLSEGIFSVTHPDYKGMMQVRQWLDEIINPIIEYRSNQLMVAKIVEIQKSIKGVHALQKPNRRCIKYGIVNQHCQDGSIKRRLLYLFSDILVVTKPKPVPLDVQTGLRRSEHRHTLKLAEGSLSDLSDSPTVVNSFEIRDKKKTFVFSCHSQEEKESYLKEIQHLRKTILRETIKK
eukprot:TRINITY_DN2767_c0_g1_i6.p1 TRINITY_DN2767_c0_g1~~TRINITY_DN2767_c0_g1_i6.p1  ORF type:complete len:560 (+),score=84.36 TRINITY_DN2767_c0_g1_i6:133-1812(+)